MKLKRSFLTTINKRLSLIKDEDNMLNQSKIINQQKTESKFDDLNSGLSKTQSKSNGLYHENNKEYTSYIPKSGESNADNNDIIRYNYEFDDQTIEISNMDTTSVNGSMNRFNLMNSLARNLSAKNPIMDSDSTSPMNVCSPVQLKHYNTKKNSSFKIGNENAKDSNQKFAGYSPMSAINSQMQMSYAFNRLNQQENEVAISDSDTEKNREEAVKEKTRIKQWALLTPATPQNRLENKEKALTPKGYFGSERRDSDASITSGPNIFNRGSKKALSRKDSIFTHISHDVNITCNPSTGEKQVNQYILMKTIGKGSYAEVWLGYNMMNKEKYAIKIIQLTKLRRILTSKTTTAVDSLKTEIVIMKKLNHKHLVKLYEVLGDQENDKIYIIAEYMKGGSLASLMAKNNLTLDQIWHYFRQIISGIEYCHTVAKICHRDIKPENMLLSDENANSNHQTSSKFKTNNSNKALPQFSNLKIADFGMSSIIENGNDSLK